MERLETLSAAEIGRLVNGGKIKPSEVLAYFKKRIEMLNPSLNAFVYTKFDEAEALAKQEDAALERGEKLGPFAGVPFGLKDFLPNKPGWASSHGGVRCLASIDEEYSPFSLAMEKAGGIPVGKTNAPAYGFRGTTDNKQYGPTRNPFALSYNAGGSSGGSAAAVAGGLIPISEGGDAGGSIRIPAAFCNLFGFKSGIGIIPSINRPDAFSASHPFCTGGGLTKTVEDAAILLNASAGYDPRDPYSVPIQKDYVEESKKSIAGRRIAYTYDFDLFPVEDAVKAQFKEALRKFADLGLPMEEVHFDFKHNLEQMSEAWCKGITIDCAISLNLLKAEGKDLLKEHPEDFPEEFLYYKKECDKLGIMNLYNFNLARTDVLDEFERVFASHDFLLSPISCVEGILNRDDGNTKGPNEIEGKPVNSLIGWAETFLANFTGNPAASLPAGFFPSGLPFGVQVIARRNKEGNLLALARAYEEKHPWRGAYPAK